MGDSQTAAAAELRRGAEGLVRLTRGEMVRLERVAKSRTEVVELLDALGVARTEHPRAAVVEVDVQLREHGPMDSDVETYGVLSVHLDADLFCRVIRGLFPLAEQELRDAGLDVDFGEGRT